MSLYAYIITCTCISLFYIVITVGGKGSVREASLGVGGTQKYLKYLKSVLRVRRSVCMLSQNVSSGQVQRLLLTTRPDGTECPMYNVHRSRLPLI